MADLDSSIPFFWQGGGTVVLTDGINSIVLTFEQGTFSFAEPGREYTEALSRGRRSTSEAPILIEGNDGVGTGQFSFLLTSVKGNTDTHPYEVMTRSGNGASWGSTARGNKPATEMQLNMDSSSATGGGLQSKTFKYAVFTNVECDMAAAEGKALCTGSWTNHENLAAAA